VYVRSPTARLNMPRDRIEGVAVHRTHRHVTYTITSSGTGTAVNLASYYNIYGIATVGADPKSGGFDNDGYAYNSSLLGTSLSYQA